MKTTTASLILYFVIILVIALTTSCSSGRYHTKPVKFKSNSCGYYFNHKR